MSKHKKWQSLQLIVVSLLLIFVSGASYSAGKVKITFLFRNQLRTPVDVGIHSAFDGNTWVVGCPRAFFTVPAMAGNNEGGAQTTCDLDFTGTGGTANIDITPRSQGKLSAHFHYVVHQKPFLHPTWKQSGMAEIDGVPAGVRVSGRLHWQDGQPKTMGTLTIVICGNHC